MTFQDQSGSWSFGGNSQNFDPNAGFFGEGMRRPFCNICRDVGHHADNCPQAKRQYSNANSPQPSFAQIGNPVDYEEIAMKCLSCHRIGHWTTDCPMIAQQSSLDGHSNFQPTLNSDTRLFGDSGMQRPCDLCRGELGYNHHEQNCPSLFSRQWNSQSCNNGENWNDSSMGLQQGISSNWRSDQWNANSNSDSQISEAREVPSPRTQLGSSQEVGFSLNSDSKLGQQVDTTQTYLERTVAAVQSMLEMFHTFMKSNDRTLEQHMERIVALEQNKSSSVQIIAEQAERIRTLEATVAKLESRLTSHQEQLEKQHEVHSRRIDKADVAIQDLNGRLVRVDSLLSRAKEEKVNHINPSYNDDSSDGEEIDVIFLSDAPGSSVKRDNVSMAEKPVLLDEYLQFPNFNIESSQTAAPKADILQADSPDANDQAILARFGEDIQSPHDSGASFSCQGLPCGPQLRACVNMIQVMPIMKKVEDDEIRTMKSRKKRKLQKLWVPRGMFDLQELFQENQIIREDNRERPVMPWWKKRQRRTQTTHDSYD